MAQLNDTMVHGDLRVTGTVYGNVTQDGNGNNIIYTYATKTELQDSNNQWGNATTALNNGKLDVDGSNASSTTVSNIFDVAAGGDADSYVIEDTDQVLLKNGMDSARKYYLSKFITYVKSKLIKDELSPITNKSQSPTISAVVNQFEKVRTNFDASSTISLSQGTETVILEIPLFSDGNLYQRVYEINISSNINNAVNFKALICPAISTNRNITSSFRVYVLGYSSTKYLQMFRLSTTSSKLLLSVMYTSSHNSNATRSLAYSLVVARGNGFNVKNTPISSYALVDSGFTLDDTTYVKSYVTSDDLNNKLYNTITKYNNGASDAFGYASLPIVCKLSVYTAETTKSASEWITMCISSEMITNGRIFVLINPSAVTYKISGLANSNTYSLNSNLSITIVYCDGNYYMQTV